MEDNEKEKNEREGQKVKDHKGKRHINETMKKDRTHNK